MSNNNTYKLSLGSAVHIQVLFSCFFLVNPKSYSTFRDFSEYNFTIDFHIELS